MRICLQYEAYHGEEVEEMMAKYYRTMLEIGRYDVGIVHV